MSSGVMRLRHARSGGGTNPIDHRKTPAQKSDAYGGAKDTSETLTVPKKQGAWDTYPTTKPPMGNESPHRGESDSE